MPALTITATVFLLWLIIYACKSLDAFLYVTICGVFKHFIRVFQCIVLWI